jgi:hypothetical protein
MTEGTKPFEGLSLGRWSRLKREATRQKDMPAANPEDIGAPIATPPPAVAAGTAAVEASAAPARVDPLPPVESLTIDSDFSAFLQPEVDETLKRQALKQLFRDPRFNVMDGLDVYIDDYSKPDPIDPDIVRQMVQGRYIFDPPPTRINAQGHVEDVPPEELGVATGEATSTAVDPDGETQTHHALPPAVADVGPPASAVPGESCEAPASDPPGGAETSTR